MRWPFLRALAACGLASMLAAGVPGCGSGGSGETYAIVHIDRGSFTGPIDRIDLTLMLGGQAATRSLTESGADIKLPTEAVFHVLHGEGTLSVSAVAFKSGAEVSSGSGMGTVTRGETDTVTVTLGMVSPDGGIDGSPDAAGPQLAIDQTSHDFGGVAIGGAPGTVTLTVRNSGSGPTGALNAALNGAAAFSKTTSTCDGAVLQAAQTCTVTITFTPTTPGPATATLMVSATPGGTVPTALSGTGVIPSTTPTSASASPAAVCPAAASTLSVSGGSLGTGASWQWYSGSCGGTSVGSGASISVSPVAATTYYVRAEGTANMTGCVSTTVTAGTQSTTPTSVSASPALILSGSSSTLTLSGGSLGTGASFQWYSGSCGGTSVGSGTSITVSPASTTTYFVRAAGTCNTTTCVSTTVTIGVSCSKTFSSGSLTGTAPESFTLNYTLLGGGGGGGGGPSPITGANNTSFGSAGGSTVVFRNGAAVVTASGGTAGSVGASGGNATAVTSSLAFSAGDTIRINIGGGGGGGGGVTCCNVVGGTGGSGGTAAGAVATNSSATGGLGGDSGSLGVGGGGGASGYYSGGVSGFGGTTASGGKGGDLPNDGIIGGAGGASGGFGGSGGRVGGGSYRGGSGGGGGGGGNASISYVASSCFL